VKVLDFGLAKLIALEAVSPEHETVTADADASPLSQPGTVTGTSGYMSPEQAMGKDVDARSDIFSFGAMLYEMVTGRRAFAGSSTAETLAAVVREQPKAPSEVVAGVPKELDRLIQRCLRKEPDRRFQHMADVKVELNEIKEESDSGTAASAVPVGRSRRWWVAIGLAGVLVLAVATWRLRWRGDVALAPSRVVRLTSMRGTEVNPTFSPDGNQIAFAWDGEKSDNWDIYLQMIGSSEIRRLTTDSGRDVAPTWSPDGRQIAFVRVRPGGSGTIHLVSPVGGSDRKLSDFPVSKWSQLAWSPDGRWLAAARRSDSEPRSGTGIHLIAVQGEEVRTITSPKAPGVDLWPAFSPEGHHLAYASCANGEENSCEAHVVDLGADSLPKGPPRVTPKPLWVVGLAWTRDQKALIYADGLTQRLWRIAVDGNQPAESLELAGHKVFGPATNASKDLLAFWQQQGSTDIYRFEPTRQHQVVLASSFHDYGPEFSPDGRRIAFASIRGEGAEIWLAAADGSNPVQLTHGPGHMQGGARWSPDGRRIAFDSQGKDGHWDIWTIDADGGLPRHITEDPGDEKLPAWSRDGRFIYFSADRGGSQDVWRILAEGGPAQRVTQTGGWMSQEGTDGKTFFFSRGLHESALLAMPLAGGEERQVTDCVPLLGFAVSRAGVYHIGCGTGPDVPLSLLDAATGRDRILGRLEEPSYGLTVSPDGKTILYTKYVGQGTDLMMIENFR
jgi:Tol biopolymer transport system component